METFKPSISEIQSFNDLEIILNEGETFLRETFKKENLPEYQWNDLVLETNNIIEKLISSTVQIQLEILNIQKKKFTRDTDYRLFHSHHNIFDKTKGIDFLNLRGENNDNYFPNDYQLNDDYYKEFKKIEPEIFVITFKEPLIKNPELGPFKSKGQTLNSIPKIKFKCYTQEIDKNLKVGDLFVFKLEYLNSYRYKGERELIILEYFMIDLVSNYPKPKSNSNSNCFVVTATMGDINHPVVTDFRNYRDKVLLNTIFGRLFIKVYYQIGPTLSEIIKKNKVLFKISRAIILMLHRKLK